MLIVLLFHGSIAAPLTHPDLESAFAARLRRARRPAEVERLRRAFDGARVVRLRCALQTERGVAPVACYDVLAREAAWGTRNPAEVARRRRRLDGACARAADLLRVPARGDDSPAVSADCRRRVRDARETNRYRAGDWSAD